MDAKMPDEKKDATTILLEVVQRLAEELGVLLDRVERLEKKINTITQCNDTKKS